MQSKYKTEDKPFEEMFSRWLDEYFYDELAKAEIILGWHRVNGEKLQKKGEDVILISTLSEECVIDEKASLHYINKNIPTFSFEVLNQSSKAIGWLFNEKLTTDYYLLAWPNGQKEINNFNDFTNSEIMVIKKKAILDLLRQKNITEESINNKIEEVINTVTPKENKVIICEGISLNFNFSLAERPINLVIRKELLEPIAIYSSIVENICPKCGSKLLKKVGKYGKFVGCSNYPNCTYISKKDYSKILTMFDSGL